MGEASQSQDLKKLVELKKAAGTPGSKRSTDRQTSSGKMLARERIAYLLDEGSFHELDMLRRGDYPSEEPGLFTDGLITGWGSIDGRKVFVSSQDFTVAGGSIGEVSAEKLHKLMDLAVDTGAPYIGLNDGAGARIGEGVVGLHGYGGIFRRNVAASGVIPQISVIMGPCAGGAVYSPAMTDFIFMVQDSSHMFITGPDVVKAVTGEEVNLEELGGAKTHSTLSGVATFVAPTEQAVLDDVRYLLSFLPSNNLESPPKFGVPEQADRVKRVETLNKILPDSTSKPYDVVKVVQEIVDDGEFVEYHKSWAQNIVCGFARIAGRSVGIVANQPAQLAGVLDIESASKAARFVRTCDAFNIALLTLVDVPGFLPGVDQEHGGVIRHGSKLLYAYCEATVPRIQVILRKAYGGAYVVMDSKGIGSDLCFAWPSAEVAVMGPQGATNILHRRELAEANNPDAVRAIKLEEYRAEFVNPWIAAARGYVDDVIDPADTRIKVAAGLEMLADKKEFLPKRKHGNVPL